MGNALAYLMLLIWPLVCFVFFARMRIERALIWSILGAYLLLPPLTEIDLPLVPNFDKFSVSAFAAIAIIFWFLKLRPPLIPQNPLAAVLMVGMLVGTIATVMTNGDPVVYQSRTDMFPIEFPTVTLPGLRLIDIMSVLTMQLVMLIPFLLARHFLSTDNGLRELFVALLVAGLIYSVPALIEIRLSPQTNVWIYGFFQHDFHQMIRDGGFRPIVFFPHALWLALFFALTAAAAAALTRMADIQQRGRVIIAMIFLLGVLYLCKSMASQIYALIMVPMIMLTSDRAQIRVAAFLALVAVTYPLLRGLGLVPMDFILAQAEAINPDRAHSLAYRVLNEEELLARTAERPLFGWGIWGRNLYLDSATGEIATVPDGSWILTFGIFGWVGYLTLTGLVALPIFLLRRVVQKQPDIKLHPLAAPLTLMLGFSMLDMLLNDTLVPVSWLMIGALLGYGERLSRQIRAGQSQTAPAQDMAEDDAQPAAAVARRRTIM